jgi:hypothetical protein
VPDRHCADCGKQFYQRSGFTAKRCPDCRSKPGHYSGSHRTLRALWQKRMDSGELVICAATRCIERSRLIVPRSAWDLGHRADGTELPEHASCNRSAGAYAGRRRSATDIVRVAELAQRVSELDYDSPEYSAVLETRQYHRWLPGDPQPTREHQAGCLCLERAVKEGWFSSMCRMP